MLKWTKQVVSNRDAWSTEGGGAFALVFQKEHGYELLAWWTKRQGPLTDPKKLPVFPTLEDAQAEAERLIFSRTVDWARLMED